MSSPSSQPSSIDRALNALGPLRGRIGLLIFVVGAAVYMNSGSDEEPDQTNYIAQLASRLTDESRASGSSKSTFQTADKKVQVLLDGDSMVMIYGGFGPDSRIPLLDRGEKGVIDAPNDRFDPDAQGFAKQLLKDNPSTIIK